MTLAIPVLLTFIVTGCANPFDKYFEETQSLYYYSVRDITDQNRKAIYTLRTPGEKYRWYIKNCPCKGEFNLYAMLVNKETGNQVQMDATTIDSGIYSYQLDSTAVIPLMTPLLQQN